MFVRFLVVFDLLFNLFRIALWPSVGKSCPIGFSLVLFYFSAVLIVGDPLSRLVFGTGCGIRMYRFLIVAFLSSFKMCYLHQYTVIVSTKNALTVFRDRIVYI